MKLVYKDWYARKHGFHGGLPVERKNVVLFKTTEKALGFLHGTYNSDCDVSHAEIVWIPKAAVEVLDDLGVVYCTVDQYLEGMKLPTYWEAIDQMN